ncbi:MAG: pilus assembly protein PilP [Burkholderiaceae bacterium]
MIIPRIQRLILSLTLLAGLSACGDGGVQEVRQWMDETRQQTKVSIPKLSEPKKFIPFTYSEKDAIDPFNPNKLAVAFAKMQSKSSSALAPDLERRREPLESYPLDALKMVGTLQKTGLSYALILADKTVYQAKIGNYVGQNFGIVTQISETAVELKEVIQDASGEWVERKAKLELQETTK